MCMDRAASRKQQHVANLIDSSLVIGLVDAVYA